MPTYTYECSVCKDIIELRHGMTEDPIVTCPKDSAVATKVILSAPNLAVGWDAQAAGNANKYWGTKLAASVCDSEKGIYIEKQTPSEI